MKKGINILRENRAKMIKKKRKEKGITQQELANMLGCSLVTVGMVECGTRGIGKRNIQKWCDVLDIDYNSFILGREDANKTKILYYNPYKILNEIKGYSQERFDGEFKIYFNLINKEFIKKGYNLVAIKKEDLC